MRWGFVVRRSRIGMCEMFAVMLRRLKQSWIEFRWKRDKMGVFEEKNSRDLLSI